MKAKQTYAEHPDAFWDWTNARAALAAAKAVDSQNQATNPAVSQNPENLMDKAVSDPRTTKPLDLEPLEEDPRERAQFDRAVALHGDVRKAIVQNLSVWGMMSSRNGSMGRVCNILANEVAKLHVEPNAVGEQPAGDVGRDAAILALNNIASDSWPDPDLSAGEYALSVLAALKAQTS